MTLTFSEFGMLKVAPLIPLVPLLGLFGCLFVVANTSRLTLFIGYLILAGSFAWYMLFLRKGTHLVGASSVLWQKKVLKPLAARAEDYIHSRRGVFPVLLVPLANPETEQSLLKLSTALARRREARLRLIHVIQVPIQTPLEAGRLEYEKRRLEQETLLDVASRHSLEQGVRAMASAVIAHNVPSAILSAAEMESPELIIMGWRGDAHAAQLRGTNMAGVLKIAKGNVLVLKDRGLDHVRRILVPMSGGPHALLGLRLASELASEWDVAILALKILKGKGLSVESSEFDRQSMALFQDQAQSLGIDLLAEAGAGAEMEVVTGEDIVETIVRFAEPTDLIVMGASNEWSLRQRLFGSIPDQVADQAPVSVLMVRSKQ